MAFYTSPAYDQNKNILKRYNCLHLKIIKYKLFKIIHMEKYLDI